MSFLCREKLCGHLPARAEGYSWTLVFSTSQHGFSLNSLYRKLQRLESPILVVIQDTEGNVSIEHPILKYFSLIFREIRPHLNEKFVFRYFVGIWCVDIVYITSIGVILWNR